MSKMRDDFRIFEQVKMGVKVDAVMDDEFALIRRLTRRALVDTQVAVGVGDDAAVVGVHPGMALVATCDAMAEGVHFTRETMRPYDIGWKALAANLSDIAAMGGIPRFALVTLNVSEGWSVEVLEEVYAGIYDLAQKYGVSLIGGDTVKSGVGLFLSVTLLGEVEQGKAKLRSAAEPGQKVFLTGPVGDSAAGLDALFSRSKPWSEESGAWLDDLKRRHQRPEPQVQAGRLLVKEGIPGALNDISDGLASEAWEIAEASKVGIVLEEAAIPLSEAAREYAAYRTRSALDWGLYGGEDFQLLGTAPSDVMPHLIRVFYEQGCTLYPCGRVVGGEQAGVFLQRNGTGELAVLPKGGYNHFSVHHRFPKCHREPLP